MKKEYEYEILIGSPVRGHFETDTVVRSNCPELVKIAEGYNRAVQQASSSATRSIQSPDSVQRTKAIWDEAVCQTLQEVLHLFEIDSGTMEDPYEVNENFHQPDHPRDYRND